MNGKPVRVMAIKLASCLAAFFLLLDATIHYVDGGAIPREIFAIVAVGGSLIALAFSGGVLFASVRGEFRSRRVLQATIDGVGRGIAAFEKGRLVARNEQFMILFRIPAELGEFGTPVAHWEKYGAGGLLTDLSQQLKSAMDANEAFMIERTRPDGAIFELFFSPPLGGIAVFGAHDATVQRRSEQFMHNAQKLDALGHLTGGIAHDFNNLLTVVLMNLDVIRKDPGITQKFGRRLELMSAAAYKGATLVRQLLAYARKQPLEAEIADLSELMPGLVDLINRTIGEDIHIDLTIADNIWPNIVDTAQFESTALNLALNARDAMPDGGNLTLELANMTVGPPAAQDNGSVPPGDYVVFKVSDTGIGMSEEVRSRAFDPFFTTKGEGRGNGLGLSMAYGFIKQSGGHIRLLSEPHNGTSVELYFPRCREAAPPRSAPRSVAASTGTERILVVEDDDKVRTTTVGVLNDLGYRTLQAANGQSALSLLEREQPVDLLFTDMVLSGAVNGRMLAEAARELQPTIKVLYTSGYAEKAARHAGGLDPGTGLLNKPYCAEELAAKLKHVMSRNSE